MSLTKYALQAQLLFRISFLSLVTTRLSSHSFPQLHSALNSEFSVSGGLWGSGLASAGPDAQLLHDDWMICLRRNPFLIGSEINESAILKLSFPSLKDQHPPLVGSYFGTLEAINREQRRLV
ncbi:hypothetical protein AMECASPLE_005259 [Ameca splendens]|uniref:Uncharacterized protein n=1 Tax=Ameca splendens TaxID=208324 RepID=A0ABV0XN82_9TELE